jgi:hypothetical protein
MNINLAKIRELLVKDYGWNDNYIDGADINVDEILEDVLNIIDGILKEHKVISINK